MGSSPDLAYFFIQSRCLQIETVDPDADGHELVK
jgi:hypothetical protein